MEAMPPHSSGEHRRSFALSAGMRSEEHSRHLLLSGDQAQELDSGRSRVLSAGKKLYVCGPWCQGILGSASSKYRGASQKGMEWAQCHAFKAMCTGALCESTSVFQVVREACPVTPGLAT
ncbi:hypothetical protein P7K49_033038 [Saguinus oedipus]|uniref:Uncharacterized protein n=1 Tax=Saguinus oedipus TaxID=9490 RepID=A0ABQ9TQT3_SAGOE|nr:hypothetical protein P7K49_033038 [Saguinus oedipus]